MKPGDFPIGSLESRAVARMQLAHRDDNRKHIQFIANVCIPDPEMGGRKSDPTRFHFGDWEECGDGSFFRVVHRPGGWLKPGDPVPVCPDCGMAFKEADDGFFGCDRTSPEMIFVAANCMSKHDPGRS